MRIQAEKLLTSALRIIRHIRRFSRSRDLRAPALVLIAALVVGSVFQAKPVAAAACPSSGDFVTISVSCNFPAGSYTFTGDLTIAAGVTVTMNGNTGGNSGVTITADNIIIRGTVTADAQGYPAGQGPGTPAWPNGAGYGGRGGSTIYNGNSGTTYGSVTQPTDLGSGSNQTTAGGGAIKLVTSSTGTLSVVGSVSANGQMGSPSSTGGGSGGSVWISTGTFTGGGSVTANGGNASGDWGPGGGGRIAVYYTTNSSTGTVTAYGGPRGSSAQNGGAGTVYMKSSIQTYGDLVVDDNNFTGNADTVQYANPASQTYDNVTVRNGADYVIPTLNSLTVNSGGTITGGGSQRPSVVVNSGGTFNPPSATQTFTNLDVTNSGVVGVVTNLTASGGTFTHNGGFSAGVGAINLNSSGAFVLNGTGVGITSLNYGSGTFVLQTANSFSLDSLTLQNGGVFEFRRTQTANLGAVTIYSGGSITQTANPNGGTKSYGIDISAQSIDIKPGGSINVDSKGYAPTYGTGAPTYPSGAGHGGKGGIGLSGTPGIAYDSPTQPADLGSGSHQSYYGGGAIKLVTPATGTVIAAGPISANGGGGNTYGAAGAAGGSVWINTGTFTGGGAISANGGNGNTGGNYGGGGGGRVAIYYMTNSSTGTISAYGGSQGAPSQDGGAGTVYMKSSSQTNGDLIVDDNNLSNNAETTQVTTASQTYDNLTIRNGADYVIPAGNALTVAPGGSVTGGGTQRPGLTANSGGYFNAPASSFTLNNLNLINNGVVGVVTDLIVAGSGTFTHNGGFSAGVGTINLNTSGAFVDNGTGVNITSLNYGSGTFILQTANSFSLSSLTLQNGGVFEFRRTQTASLGAVTVYSGGNITQTANPNGGTKSYGIDISAQSIDIKPGGSINVDSKGYAPTYGTGAPTFPSGAGHGGKGGIGLTGTAGVTYDSPTQPTDLGSGSHQWFTGGGAIKLVTPATGTVIVAGTVSANGGGGASNGAAGAAGGSVWINTGTFTGGGTISANGGAGNNTGNYGGGGGGRVAIYYVTNSSTGTITAYGGAQGITSQDGGAGTVYWKSSVASNGDLIVDANNLTNNAATTQVSSTSQTYDNLTVRNGADYVIPSGSTLTVASGGTITGGGSQKPTLTVQSGGTYTPLATGTVTSLDVTVNSGGTLGSGSTINLSSSNFSQSGSYGGSLASVTVGSSSTFTNTASGTVTVTGAVTVNSGGSLVHAANPANNVKAYNLDLNVGSLTVASGGSVNLNGLGFPSGYGPGVGTTVGSGNSGGGGYGGAGGTGASGGGAGGPAYGTQTSPDYLGSGAGKVGSNSGGTGGGQVKIVSSGTVTVNSTGSISVDGSAGTNTGTGGGSGGSIWISCSTFAGNGTLSAKGGSGQGAAGGGGGGGRIYVLYTSSTYTGSATATGGSVNSGSRSGVDGSVLLAQNAPTVTGSSPSPTSPFVTDSVTVSASATYTTAINRMDLLVDGADPTYLVKTCLFSPAVTSAFCSGSAGLLSRGAHVLWTKAYGTDSTVTTASSTFTVGGSTGAGQLQVSRLKTGATGSFALSYTLSGTSSQNLVVTFPAGFTVNSAFTSGSGCLSNFGYTALTLTANVTNCNGTVTASGASITNPLTPGTYTVTWTDDNGSGSIIVVNDDQIGVTGDVDPSLTFNVGSQASATACGGTFSGNGGTLSLGTLSSSFVTTSDATGTPHICTRVSTNAASGVSVSVKSANSALTSILTPADSIPSSTALLSAGTSGYGLCVGSSGSDSGTDATVPVGAAPRASSPFGSACTTSAHNVGGLTSSFQNLWTLSGASQNAFARLYVKAAISATVPAHNDYADTLTFIATGTY